jgi:hypothetical protein
LQDDTKSIEKCFSIQIPDEEPYGIRMCQMDGLADPDKDEPSRSLHYDRLLVKREVLLAAF